MAVIATDDFNRANTTGPDLGTNWTNVSSGGFAANGFQIVSNHAEPTSLGSDKLEFYSGAVFPADQYSQAKITVTGTTIDTGPGVAVRCASDGSCYRLVVNKNAANNLKLQKFVAGAFTTLDTDTVAWSDGDTLKLQISGTTMTKFRNGVQVGSTKTDSSLSSGPPGISYSSTTTVAQVDDWEGGNLTVSGSSGPVRMMMMGVG